MKTITCSKSRAKIKNYVNESEVRKINTFYDYNIVLSLANLICIKYCKKYNDMYKDALEYVKKFYKNINEFLQNNTSVYYYNYKNALYDIVDDIESIDKVIDVLKKLSENIFSNKVFLVYNENYYNFEEAYDVETAVKETKKYVKKKYSKKEKIKNYDANEIIETHYRLVKKAYFNIVEFTIDVLEEVKKIMNEIRKREMTSL